MSFKSSTVYPIAARCFLRTFNNLSSSCSERLALIITGYIFFEQRPLLKHNLPIETLGGPPPPRGDLVFELKQLLNTLKYAYLDEKKIYPVIISANLSEHEEERLLKVLRKHRAAIGYTLDDLNGISPTLCQHKINMEPDAKPVVDDKRRLNPKMKEVVRKEILKLLEAGIIYPIADTRWVSLVHCALRKEVLLLFLMIRMNLFHKELLQAIGW